MPNRTVILSKCYRRSFWIALGLTLAPSGPAWGWGDRGHHLISSVAARALETWVQPGPETSAFAAFFRDRDILLGHVSNLPDSSWRDTTRRRIAKLNSPNHYFGPERVLGIPTDEKAFLAKMRALPADYAEIKRLYDGKANALPGGDHTRPFWTYEDLGVTPWRSQQLYDLIVSAWSCAKHKEGAPQPANLSDQPFEVPADGTGDTVDPPLPTYRCRTDVSRRADIQAALLLSGILSHFIGDQGQPYHPTADYDGWVTGNGGIHGYFEIAVVQALDERLLPEVSSLARSVRFRQSIWKKVGTDLHAPNAIARLQLLLGADSHAARTRVRMIDDRVAIMRTKLPDGTVRLGKSATLPWGAIARGLPLAERYPAETAAVQAAFRPLIVERLAASVVVLSRVWLAAWEAGGRPTLIGQSWSALPYPLDVPFIWPDFDLDAVARTKGLTPSQK